METLPHDGAAVKPPVVIRNARDHYRLVNSLWPKELPKLDGPEAISAAKRLWRVATGKAWNGTWKLTSGNRNSGPFRRRGVFFVNPDQGWSALVHDISHDAHWACGHGTAHSGDHARLEAKLIRYVVEHGWLDGKLKSTPKPKPAKVPLVERRAARAKSALERARHRLKLAEAAVKRLTPRVKRYDSLLAKAMPRISPQLTDDHLGSRPTAGSARADLQNSLTRAKPRAKLGSRLDQLLAANPDKIESWTRDDIGYYVVLKDGWCVDGNPMSNGFYADTVRDAIRRFNEEVGPPTAD